MGSACHRELNSCVANFWLLVLPQLRGNDLCVDRAQFIQLVLSRLCLERHHKYDAPPAYRHETVFGSGRLDPCVRLAR